MEAKDFTVNQDGSFSISIDGKVIKLVKESDLLAVKAGAERKEAELMTQLATANGDKDTTHAKFLEVQTAKEAVEAKIKELEPFKTQVDELGKKIKAAEDGSKQLSDKLLGKLKASLMTQYGVKEDLLKDKPLTELERLEEAAKVLSVGGNGKKPANFDGAGGASGAGGGSTQNARERIRTGFDVLHPTDK